LLVTEQYTVLAGGASGKVRYDSGMAKHVSALKRLREATGLSQRELARLIGQEQSNVSFWERTGRPPRSDLLVPIAEALGVSIEELLGLPRPKNTGKPGGRLGKVVDQISRMPRRQRDRVIRTVETLLAGEQVKSEF